MSRPLLSVLGQRFENGQDQQFKLYDSHHSGNCLAADSALMKVLRSVPKLWEIVNGNGSLTAWRS